MKELMNIKYGTVSFSTQVMKNNGIADIKQNNDCLALVDYKLNDSIVMDIFDNDKLKEKVWKENIWKNKPKIDSILNKYYNDEDLNNIFGTDLTIEEQIKLILNLTEGILNEVKSVNSLGFINSFTLNDANKFPLTSKILDHLIGSKENGMKYDLKVLSDKDLTEVIKWWYNIIHLDLYIVLKILILQIKETDQDKYNDIICDLSLRIGEIHNGLESYIKIGLKKQGITINQNIYTGFDSEYQYKNSNIKESICNDLLSVQLAVSTRLVLKLPNPVKFYDPRGVNSHSGIEYKTSSKNPRINYKSILNTIDSGLKYMREILYPGYDATLDRIIKGLKEKIPYVEKESSIYFQFNKSTLKTWFSSNVEKGVSLTELVGISTELANKDLNIAMENLWELLSRLSNSTNIIGVKAEVEEEEEGGIRKEFEFNDNFSKNENKSNIVLIKNNQGTIIKNTHNTIIEETNTVDSNTEILNIIGETEPTVSFTNVENEYNSGKKYVRMYKQNFTPQRASITIKKNNYFIGHLTSADLSILEDFDKFKDELDIVNNAMVTLKKPLLINGVNVIFRDTMLLAPAGNRSLKTIGGLYNAEKIQIGSWIENMAGLLKEDPVTFEQYAVQDAKITLIHALFMEEFAFKYGLIGVPLSLSMLSSTFLRHEWNKKGYEGYQINPEYYINDSKTQTPKGLFSIGSVGLYISNYIANYKGGRNESFMYGIDEDLKWYDYDLISAYTTGMSLMGNPDYKNARILMPHELNTMSDKDIVLSYIIIKATFKFPDNVKYPSIPCFLDETTTIYPLSGNCMLTGAEYILAKQQDCKFEIENIYYIPFEQVDTGIKDSKFSKFSKNKNKPLELLDSKLKNQPFYDVIKDLQSKRKMYPKGTINNLLYKELGNSIYGLVVKGISNKKKFDVRLGRTVRMEGNDLSNPILASWITAFIRSVIGELLHNGSKLQGKIISVTTDGFLTDVQDFETKVLELESNTLLKLYKEARMNLSQDNLALEIKKEGKGLISWTTRGQFSLEGNLIASTGFQKALYNMKEIDKLLKDGMASESKEITFVSKRLRSALDIYKFGGHVTNEYKDQVFRLVYDNKRKIIFDESKEKTFEIDRLLDSNPVKNVDEAGLYRTLSKKPYVKKYQRQLNVRVFRNKYKNVLEITIRNFIRSLLSGTLNLENTFENYTELSNYINEYDKDLKITPAIIAQLKRRAVKPKKLYRDSISGEFVKYIIKRFPRFDDKKFFNEYED